jgi:hypothetical protein
LDILQIQPYLGLLQIMFRTPTKLISITRWHNFWLGTKLDGNIRDFDEDGNISAGTKLKDCYFVNFARLLQKDEIKKGTLPLELGVSGTNDAAAAANNFADFAGANFKQRIKIHDASGSNSHIKLIHRQGSMEFCLPLLLCPTDHKSRWH